MGVNRFVEDRPLGTEVRAGEEVVIEGSVSRGGAVVAEGYVPQRAIGVPALRNLKLLEMSATLPPHESSEHPLTVRPSRRRFS